MDFLQQLVDVLGKLEQQERSASGQYTLGLLIERLKLAPEDAKVTGFGKLESYRGYYCDLAFRPSEEVITVKELLARCYDAMGKVFTGYKGGDYVMHEKTPLWISEYGEASNMKLMGLENTDGALKPITEYDLGF